MKHEEMMDKAWRFINETGITESKEDYEKNNDLILVESIYQVRGAYYADLENGKDKDYEDVFEFLNKHGIKFE
ncbi:MAG: hypothetical protein LLF98_02420 [Clostridium sp.]|uniref:hypothetical protein n=1 Tax=Clostridium sp. TaxID=1506 RepID=UPI0025BF98C2|nr:hypothetical protein [Clostridium sp.]MCE5220137.1 hypothetical protein [Clostridium sp.]